jgi:hypothetical protein
MARKTKTTTEAPRIRPALTPEARENQLIALATNAAEKMLLDGTAPASVICHYLKLGSMKEKYEIEKLKGETALQMAKIEALESQKHIEELYTEAMDAFKKYSGSGDE